MKRIKAFSKILPVMLISSLCIANLGGCALLPAEDTGRPVPTVASKAEASYNMVVVNRSDITITRNITFNYTEKGGIDLSFAIGGKKFGNIYVQKGDTVAEGDLLATLDMGTLASDIENLELNIAEHERQLAQSMELKELELNKVNTKYEFKLISATERDNEIAKIEESYTSSNAYLEETLYLEKLEYDTLLIKQKNSSIYAPMDGIITYFNSELKNDDKTSVQGKTMLTITDPADCTFQTKTEYRDLFTDGETITIEMTKGGSGTYDAVVEFSPDNDQLMYIYPTEEIADLSIGGRASISIVTDTRTNVLTIPNSAMKSTADGRYYVYYVNDDGIRDIKFIEIGLMGEGVVEILSGLEYGEHVIKN